MENSKWVKKDKRLIASIILNIVEGILTGSVLGFVFMIVDGVFNDSFNLERLMSLSLILGIVFIIRFILYSIGYTLGHIGGSSTAKDIRLTLGDKIRKLPLLNFSKYKSGEFINALTHDVNSYEDILSHKSGDIAKNITLSVITLISMMVMNFKVGVWCLIIALTIVPFMYLSIKLVNKYAQMKKEILNDNVSDLVEYISGVQIFRSYGLGGVKNKKINNSLKAISDISYKFESKVVPVGCIYNTVENLSVPLAMIIGGKQWINNGISTSQYIMCTILSFFVSQLMCTLFVDLTSYKNLMISKASMDKLVGEKEEVYSTQDFKPNSYDIEFKGVSFSYIKGSEILQDIHFNIKGGLTAIVGDSGSGKSTILNLISKFYEADKGEIKIGGKDIKDIDSEKILKNISMVYQDVFLFNDTIKNNIRFARPEASELDIIKACKEANCHDFIVSLENGYDTVVGENGSKLSGGEKQRISIARAILKDSPIILLDEATSSLDIENEYLVKQAIARLLSKNKTIIMIAHNLSVIKSADNILVVSEGQILESGSHNELIKQQGKYFTMWNSERALG
ncbi:ABC transporter ATP-binding protein [Clostridium intestinale]|uniref:ABC transporter-like protein n=1 Tax=Clostridium intestinale URNW TaxID=1294142 RepID=U2PV42_9CLOT|nr:ABC transporter ATP-binding protein [Clostridium intestinale]ERK30315.1 ABC transporter-like protein [Clostridium intestinale URNW]